MIHGPIDRDDTSRFHYKLRKAHRDKISMVKYSNFELKTPRFRHPLSQCFPALPAFEGHTGIRENTTRCAGKTTSPSRPPTT